MSKNDADIVGLLGVICNNITNCRQTSKLRKHAPKLQACAKRPQAPQRSRDTAGVCDVTLSAARWTSGLTLRAKNCLAAPLISDAKTTRMLMSKPSSASSPAMDCREGAERSHRENILHGAKPTSCCPIPQAFARACLEFTMRVKGAREGATRNPEAIATGHFTTPRPSHSST